MRRILLIVIVLAVLLSACQATPAGVAPTTPIEFEPPIDASQIASNPPPPTVPPTAPTEEAESVQTLDYSNFVGIWRGYSIAISYTLVITDVIDNEMIFHFVELNKLCPMGLAPNRTSPVYTMPIIDSQISFVDEWVNFLGEPHTKTHIIIFYDGHINLLVSFHDYGGNEWRLERIDYSSQETENVQSFDCSSFVGIWRGYSMATFQTFVITDVIDNEMTLYGVYLQFLCAMGESPSWASPPTTLPIIGNQITLSENSTLTFYESHIIHQISSSDSEHEWQWVLRPISSWH